MTNATWKKQPVDNNFNSALNWTPAVVPDGTAIFGASDQRDLTISAGATLRTWTLNAQAGAYTFLLPSGQSLEFTGAGIVIQHGSATVTDDGLIFFEKSSSAGKAQFTMNGFIFFDASSSAGNAQFTVNAGEVVFANNSKAANATIAVNAGEVDFAASSSAGKAHLTVNAGGAELVFDDNSKAGSATITVHASSFVVFNNSSSAGSAHINVAAEGELAFNDDSSAGSAKIVADGGGLVARVDFMGSASAANAHFTVNETGLVDFDAMSSADKAHFTVNNDGEVVFAGSSKAASAAIALNAGGVVAFEGMSSAVKAHIAVKSGAVLDFENSSSAGNAHINVDQEGELRFDDDGNAGTAKIAINDVDAFAVFEGSSMAGTATITVSSGAELEFVDESSADHATINNAGKVFFEEDSSAGDASLMGAGTFDFSGRDPGPISAASIQGAGTYDLGAHQLTLTGNRSTKVTGLIADGGVNGGSFASIVKQGTGTLTLAHQHNTYAGGTFIDQGTLNVAALGAAGTGDIYFNASTPKQTLVIQKAAISDHVFDNSVQNFIAGDKIDLAGLKFVAHAKATVVGGDTLVVKSGHVTDTLNVFSIGDGPIKVVNDGHGGTELIMQPFQDERPDAQLNETQADAEHGATAAMLDPLHLGL